MSLRLYYFIQGLTNSIFDTIKLLKDANLIETRTGAIMLNPKIAHKGKFEKERYLLQKFVMFNEEEIQE